MFWIPYEGDDAEFRRVTEIEEEQTEWTRYALRTLRVFIVRHQAEIPPDTAKVRMMIAQERILKIVTDYPDLHRFDVYAAGTAMQLQIGRSMFCNMACPNRAGAPALIESGESCPAIFSV